MYVCAHTDIFKHLDGAAMTSYVEEQVDIDMIPIRM